MPFEPAYALPHDADPAARRLLDMRLVPHRSLSPKGFRWLMIGFVAAAIFTGLPFVIAGAWPVAGFFGLDIALIFVAFKASYRGAAAYQHIVVTPLEILLRKVNARGGQAEYRFNPAWVRLDKEVHEEFGVQRLLLRSRGRSVAIAEFLGPDAKADFAGNLSQALSTARRGPDFDHRFAAE